MKRTAALILVLAMALALCACGKSEPQNPLIGTWERDYGGTWVFKENTITITRSDGDVDSYHYDLLDEAHIRVDHGYDHGGTYVSQFRINGDTLELEWSDWVTLYRVR